MTPKQLIDELCACANWEAPGRSPAPALVSLAPAVARMDAVAVHVAAGTLLDWLASRARLGLPWKLRLDQSPQPLVRQLLLTCPDLASLFEVRDDRVDLAPAIPPAEQRELELYAPVNRRPAPIDRAVIPMRRLDADE